MKARFQADADLNEHIVMALIRREPSLAFRTAEEAGLPGLPDEAVLALASEDNRILVSHDRKTMSRHFAEFIISRGSPRGIYNIANHLVGLEDRFWFRCML